jgi:hypothetical protein
MYVAASGGPDDTDPWGYSPDLQALWSTEAVEICLDGCEATRVEKVAAITQSDIALKSLRVCLRSRKGLYNCGTCEKCLRTMISLYAAGALERCTTFPRTLTPRRVYQMKIAGQWARLYARQNLEALEEKGLNPRLCLALRRAAYGRGKGGKSEGTRRWLIDSVLWRLGWRPCRPRPCRRSDRGRFGRLREWGIRKTDGPETHRPDPGSNRARACRQRAR